MKTEEISAHSSALLMKISVITGWQVPESEEFVRVIHDQFQKKIIESYSDMNVDEIEYAIRTYGTQIPDWGKSINLSLIDQAITSYLTLRREVSDYEEKLSKPRKEIVAAPADWSDEWEKIKGTISQGRPVKFIPVSVYDWLDRENKIDLSTDQKNELIKKEQSKLLADLKNKILSEGQKPEWKSQIKMLESGKMSNRLKVKIINRSKVAAVIYLAEKQISGTKRISGDNG